MSAYSVCPFSNLSYARKLPPRVTAIFILFLMFDLFFYLLQVPVIQNQIRIVLTRQSLGFFCREAQCCLCACAPCQKIGVGGPEWISSLHPMAPTVSITNLIKPDYFIVFVDFYSFSICEGWRWSLAIGGNMQWGLSFKSYRLLMLAHLKAPRISASTCKHPLCTHVWNVTHDCLKNSPTQTMHHLALAFSCGSYPLLAKNTFWIIIVFVFCICIL